MAIKKPQSPMRFEDTDERFYPLTDETQVVMEDGTRLNHVIKELKKNTINNYTHTTGALTGEGANGKFKATVSETVSSITVNGTKCTIKCGDEPEMELIAGCWYTFILDGSVVNFNKGGAGAGLNFKIVGDTSEPTSPSENMIWINTDTAIGEWQIGYNEPTTRIDGSALIAGDVWIELDESRIVSLNALRKNGINLTLGQVKQYDGTAWVAVEGSVYQDNAWNIIDGRYYLIYEGNYIHLNDDWSTPSRITNGDGYVEMTFPSSTANNNNNTAFDVTNYSKICYEVIYHSKETEGISYGITTASTGSYSERIAISGESTDPKTGIFSIDLSDDTGIRYLTIRANSIVVRLKSVWLE